MKPGTLAKITDNWTHGSWTEYHYTETNLAELAAGHRPSFVKSVSTIKAINLIGLLCEVLMTQTSYGSTVSWVYLVTQNTYTDVYTSDLEPLQQH